MSVGSPAGHVHGLIPYCLENPALRVERRVDLWRNCFISSFSRYDWFPVQPEFWLDDYHEDIMSTLYADTITRPVAEWMVEASLPHVPEAITLVLDGDPVPEHTALIFREVVQRDAAWQRAIETAPVPADEDISISPHWRRYWSCYHFERFPELLRAVCDNEPGSRIRCNFDPGVPWEENEVEKIIESNRANTRSGDWDDAWRRRGCSYRTAPPLPDLHSLKEEYVFPDAWVERDWVEGEVHGEDDETDGVDDMTDWEDDEIAAVP